MFSGTEQGVNTKSAYVTIMSTFKDCRLFRLRARRPSRLAGRNRNAGEVALPFTFRPAPQRRH